MRSPRKAGDKFDFQLQTEHKVVGVKQSRKAVQRGEARLVLLAEDADPQVTEPMQALCNEAQVPVELIPRMSWAPPAAFALAVPSPLCSRKQNDFAFNEYFLGNVVKI